MSDDGQKIQVQIGAQIGDLESGMDAAASAVNSSTDEMVAAVDKMAEATTESTEASESAFRRMADTVGESVTQMNEQLEGFSKAIAGVQKGFALLGEVAVLGFVGDKIADLGKEYAEFGEQTEIAAQKSGMSMAAVQELGFAANMTGVSAEGMNQAMMRLARAMTSAEGGSKPLQASFEELGISAAKLSDMSVDQVLEKIADKFSSTEDGAVKAGIAMQLFGRSGSDLIPLLNKGSDGINELRQRAEDLGIVMGGDDVEAGVKLNEQLKEMDAQMTAVKLRAGSDLAPAFTQIVAAMATMDEKGGAIDEMFSALGVVLKGIVSVAIMTGVAFDTMANVIVTAGAAMIEAIEGNYKQAVTQIQIGATDIYNAASKAQEALDKMWDAAKEGNSIDMGEGNSDWSEKGQLKAPDASGGQGASQIEKWKEQLQEQQEASGDFFKSNLANEQAFWESKLALVAKGSKDYIDVQHELFGVNSQLAHQALADSLATIKQQEDQEQGATVHKIELANQAAQEIGAAYGYQSAQYKTAIAEMLKIGKEYADQQTADADAAIQRQTASLLAGIAKQEEAQKSAFKTHQESSEQETAALLDLENQKYAIEQAGLAKEMALYDQSSKAYRDLLKQQEKDADAHSVAMAQIANQGAQQTQAAWDAAFKSLDGTLNSSVMGMIRGTETLHQAMVKTADSMLSTMINTVLQMAEKWLQGELMKTAATLTGTATRTAATAVAATAGMGAEAAAGKQTITNDAYQAAASTYASVSDIPVVGYILAPAAAAAAFTAVEAFGSGIASAAGGYLQVPHDMVANIHKDEMVLPSWAAQGVRNMIGAPGASGASGSGGGGTPGSSGGPSMNFTYAPNVQALDGASVKGVLMQHADTIFNAVSQQLRQFQR